MNQQEELHDLAAPYALDALDEPERRRFEAHLAGCKRCSKELRWLQNTASALAYAEELPPPSEELRERILEQVRSEGDVVVPLRRRWVGPVGAGLAAAAACAAIGLGIWAASLSRSLDEEREARRAGERAIAVLAQADRRAPLSGGKGTLYVTPRREGALVVTGIEPAPEGKTYEVWVVRRGTARRAGLFSGEASRSIVPLTRRVPEGAVVAVTLEKAGGVDVPQGKILFRTEA